ncbi:MAG: DUF3160 domain-containing protein [Candidatus Heimdallarchaeota archaeon]|nr:MAG: DUF3160 domain-containing protein [Candidatus Heimdallarchaeota archaeon]
MTQIMKNRLNVVVIIGLIIPLVNVQFLNSTQSSPQPDNEISELGYFQSMVDAFNLTDEELALFEQNDFVVLNRLGNDHLLDTFQYYWEQDLPIIITTDSMLHTWHLIFNEILKKYETNLLAPVFREWTLSVFNSLDAINVTTDDPIIRDVLIYLSVGARLADSHINIPSSVEETTNQLINAIYDEIDILEAIEQFQTYQIMRFIDDFTMYRPRGHYTETEELEQYFRLVKWFSRIPFFFDDYLGEIYFQRSPEELIRESFYLLYVFKTAQVQIQEYGLDATGLEVIHALTKLLDKLAGLTYTIPIESLDQLAMTVEETTAWHPDNLDNNDLETIQNQITANNSIPIPQDIHIINLLHPIFPEQDPKTFLVFGERLNLDTYAGNHLVYPYVNKRFPNGLEIASTIFHSQRARDYLAQNEDSQYQVQLDVVYEEIDQWPVVEKQALTYQWMDALKTLTTSEPEFNGSSPVIPTFMKTSAWHDEKLTTVLGSWAELKHDTILYQKQGLTYGGCSTPEGYVEPYPTFYQKLNHLGLVFQDALDELRLLGSQEENLNYTDVFTKFSEITHTLEAIAYHELEGKELTQEEKSFITTTYQLKCMSGTIILGWLGHLLDSLYEEPGYPEEQPKSALIADVHTDLMYQRVLEVATGMSEHLIAKVPGWNGTEILAVGPVFSYYEFILPVKYRMTDEDWRGIFDTRYNDTYNCDFSIFPRGPWAQSYMVSTEMTTSVLQPPQWWWLNHSEYSPPEWFLNDLEHSEYSPPDWFFIDFCSTPCLTTNPFTTDPVSSQPNDDGIQANEDGIQTQKSSDEPQEFSTPGGLLIIIVISMFSLRVVSKRKKKKSRK